MVFAVVHYITSSIREREAEVHSRFDEVRSYLHAKRKGWANAAKHKQYLLSKAVHSFTHETHVKSSSSIKGRKEPGQVQAGNYSRFVKEGIVHFLCSTRTAAIVQKIFLGLRKSHVVTASLCSTSLPRRGTVLL